MRYYRKLNEQGVLEGVGVGAGGEEITREEYLALRDEICTKAELVRQLDRGTITQEDVPEVWREEIIRRARELALDREAALGQDIDAQEALNIILGGEQA